MFFFFWLIQWGLGIRQGQSSCAHSMLESKYCKQFFREIHQCCPRFQFALRCQWFSHGFPYSRYSRPRFPPGTCLGHEAAVHAVAFCRDARLLVSASSDQTARVWADRRCLAVLRHRGEVRAACFGTRRTVARHDVKWHSFGWRLRDLEYFFFGCFGMVL